MTADMNMTNIDFTNSLDHDKRMEFSRSIIDGVEIKVCRNDPHAYKPHVHNELSLGYIIDGSTDLTLNGRIVHYTTGDGVIIPPLTTHQCAPNDINHWAYVMLFVDPDYYGSGVTFRQAKKLTGRQAQKITGFIEELTAEQHPDALENILIDLLLEFGEKSAAAEAPANDRGLIESIRDYILEHVHDDITLDHLEEISGLNKFTIIRNFKKLYVATPAAFHLQYRVAEAKRLLSKGADVFDVCEELRFYDQAHLIREFKKMYGMTPGLYVEKLNG